MVPAAGLSRRFGGPNKLLQPWNGTTIVAAVVRALIDSGLEVVLVTGRDAERVAEATPGARPVFNSHYEEGLGTSIAVGVVAVPAGSGILIALADMPNLRAETIQAILSAYTDEMDIVAPVYESEPDRPGHPVLFGSAYRDELMALAGDEGARSILKRHRDRLRLIRVPGTLDDIDVPPNP